MTTTVPIAMVVAKSYYHSGWHGRVTKVVDVLSRGSI